MFRELYTWNSETGTGFTLQKVNIIIKCKLVSFSNFTHFITIKIMIKIPNLNKTNAIYLYKMRTFHIWQPENPYKTKFKKN